jgi:hypothetical protein
VRWDAKQEWNLPAIQKLEVTTRRVERRGESLATNCTNFTKEVDCRVLGAQLRECAIVKMDWTVSLSAANANLPPATCICFATAMNTRSPALLT